MSRPLITREQLEAYLDRLTPERREEFLATLRQALAMVPQMCAFIEKYQAAGIDEAERFANGEGRFEAVLTASGVGSASEYYTPVIRPSDWRKR